VLIKLGEATVTKQVTLCESSAMDAAYFGHWQNPAPVCDEPASADRNGYRLCKKCAVALDLLGILGKSIEQRHSVARWWFASKVMLCVMSVLIALMGASIVIVMLSAVWKAVGR
jgi:hypothetical protein